MMKTIIAIILALGVCLLAPTSEAARQSAIPDASAEAQGGAISVRVAVRGEPFALYALTDLSGSGLIAAGRLSQDGQANVEIRVPAFSLLGSEGGSLGFILVSQSIGDCEPITKSWVWCRPVPSGGFVCETIKITYNPCTEYLYPPEVYPGGKKVPYVL